MLCINCAVYRARLARDRMPTRWPNAMCQSIGKVKELSAVSHEPARTGLVSLGAAPCSYFASWLLRCVHRKLRRVDGSVQLCASSRMLVLPSRQHHSPFSVFMLVV